MTRRLIVLIPLSLLLAGCLSQQSAPTNYYVLEFDPSVAGAAASGAAAAGATGAAGPEAGPAVIVQDAEVAPMFDRRQLLQRLEGPLVRYRSGDLWAVSPSTAVADLVREGLLHSGRFAAVREGRNAAGRYQAVVRIEELTHYCCAAAVEAEVAGELLLYDLAEPGSRGGDAGAVTPVARHGFSRREALADETPLAFVEAVARILSEELVAFLAGIPDELE